MGGTRRHRGAAAAGARAGGRPTRRPDRGPDRRPADAGRDDGGNAGAAWTQCFAGLRDRPRADSSSPPRRAPTARCRMRIALETASRIGTSGTYGWLPYPPGAGGRRDQRLHHRRGGDQLARPSTWARGTTAATSGQGQSPAAAATRSPRRTPARRRPPVDVVDPARCSSGDQPAGAGRRSLLMATSQLRSTLIVGDGTCMSGGPYPAQRAISRRDDRGRSRRSGCASTRSARPGRGRSRGAG